MQAPEHDNKAAKIAEHHALPLSAWVPAHSASIELENDGSIIFNDQSQWDWHLIRVADQKFHAMVNLRIVAKPLPSCNSEIYVNHWNGVDVCRVTADGTVADAAYARDIGVSKLGDGFIEICVRFFNDHETISVGTSRGYGGRYQGTSSDQYLFKSIDISIEPQSSIKSGEEIIFVDVGARYGLPAEWKALRNMIKPVLFEPDPEEAERLRVSLASQANWVPSAIVVASALANADGDQTLYVTRHPGCCSLLEPNDEILKRYRIAPAFDVMRTINVSCQRYDTLHKLGQVPVPDVVKIDVQGFEYEVLEGFGDLLNECLAIELEAQFYPVYKNQKLIGDITTFLDGFGFSLRKASPQPAFDGDAVEFNAYYTKRLNSMPAHAPSAEHKLSVVEKMWGLSVSDAGHYMAAALLGKQ